MNYFVTLVKGQNDLGKNNTSSDDGIRTPCLQGGTMP